MGLGPRCATATTRRHRHHRFRPGGLCEAEPGLRRVLAKPAAAAEPQATLPPFPKWDSGGRLGGSHDRPALYRAMEGEELLIFDTNVLLHAADERSAPGLV